MSEAALNTREFHTLLLNCETRKYTSTVVGKNKAIKLKDVKLIFYQKYL